MRVDFTAALRSWQTRRTSDRKVCEDDPSVVSAIVLFGMHVLERRMLVASAMIRSLSRVLTGRLRDGDGGAGSSWMFSSGRTLAATAMILRLSSRLMSSFMAQVPCHGQAADGPSPASAAPCYSRSIAFGRSRRKP